MSAVCTFHVSVCTTPSFQNSQPLHVDINERFQQPTHADICECMGNTANVHASSPLKVKRANDEATTEQGADHR